MSQAKAKPKPYNKQTFISSFNSIAKHRHRYEVFKDFVTMSAIAIHNAICKNEDLEKEYLDIVGKYKKEEVNGFCELLANFIELIDVEPADVLGSLYMELDLGNLNNGQFFTPHDISLLMAKLTYGDVLDDMEKPFVTLSEPACGAGGMVLAFVNEMLKKGLDPAQKLFCQCIDIDRLASLMCYLQLSLWNIPAEVVVGNTISMEFREVYYTPAYYLGDWKTRLLIRRFSDLLSESPEATKTEDKVENPKTSKPVDEPTLSFSEAMEPTTHTEKQIQITLEITDAKEDETTTASLESDVISKPDKTKNKNPGLQLDLFDFMIDH